VNIKRCGHAPIAAGSAARLSRQDLWLPFTFPFGYSRLLLVNYSAIVRTTYSSAWPTQVVTTALQDGTIIAGRRADLLTQRMIDGRTGAAGTEPTRTPQHGHY
jgi:hypothetical protein